MQEKLDSTAAAIADALVDAENGAELYRELESKWWNEGFELFMEGAHRTDGRLWSNNHLDGWLCALEAERQMEADEAQSEYTDWRM